jgi:phosphatidylserine/phosphatidylglycerophosphate/cardiolipin synthase-like enzyme
LERAADWLAYNGFDLKLVMGPNPKGSPIYQKMHNKFMVVDGKLLETGSYNYTPNAEQHNFDNSNFFTDDPLIRAFLAFFEEMYAVGEDHPKPKTPPQHLGPEPLS